MVSRVITKALAGVEDLLLGTGIVNQDRAGTTTPITSIDASSLIYENAETLRTRFGKKIEVVENVAALQALVTATVAEVYVYLLGYTTAGDGGGGLFWLDTTDIATAEDLNIVFNPDVLANGRWKRVDTDDYMSLDRGDADYAIQAFDFGIHLFATTLTADRTVTLPTTGLYKGKRVTVLRTVGGTVNLLIGAIATLTGTGKVVAQYDGSAWVVLEEPVTAVGSFNGSFEIDGNGDGIPDGWNVLPVPLGSVAIDSSDSVHGLNSVKFTSGGNGGGLLTSPAFDVLSGSTLTVNYTFKASAAAVLTNIVVLTFDRAGGFLSSLVAHTDGATNPLTYTTRADGVTIDATAVTAILSITGIDAGSTTKVAGTTMHFDNIWFS